MKKATQQDKPLVVKLLAASFDQNQSVNYIVSQDVNRKRRIKALMDYSFEVCYRYGAIFLSEDRKACALVLYPQLKRTTLWLDIQLILKVIGITRIGKALKRESLIKQKQIQGPAYYLWFIGVDPLHQHMGIGTRFLNELLQHARLKDLLVLLETSTVQNLPWYKRAGFEEYATLNLGYTLHFLKHV
jgi:ribosomal protein S18 acetylase RimI-like enzyme